MAVNINSLQAKLANIAREKKIDLQLVLNRLGSEQFLYRLSKSPYVDNFIFKGGFLLAYLINSERKTKDLDFSITQMDLHVETTIDLIKEVISIPFDDGIEWTSVEGKLLEHPEMEFSGVRVMCRFLLGKMKGYVRMDLAKGDVAKAVEQRLKRIRYKDEPLIGDDFSLFVYPLESIFAEKLQITFKKGSQNTRMKDFYDLMKLTEQPMDREQLKASIQETFANRKMEFKMNIDFKDEELDQLKTYWRHFLKRDNPPKAPVNIADVISQVNAYLSIIYET